MDDAESVSRVRLWIVVCNVSASVCIWHSEFLCANGKPGRPGIAESGGKFRCPARQTWHTESGQGWFCIHQTSLGQIWRGNTFSGLQYIGLPENRDVILNWTELINLSQMHYVMMCGHNRPWAHCAVNTASLRHTGPWAQGWPIVNVWYSSTLRSCHLNLKCKTRQW